MGPTPWAAGEPAVPLGQQPQHRRVIRRANACQVRRPQRRDRDRAGVVGIVLVRLPRAEHAHAGGQRGGHVEGGFAGGDELLGEEVAAAAGALDRPGPLLERRGPRQQALEL